MVIHYHWGMGIGHVYRHDQVPSHIVPPNVLSMDNMLNPTIDSQGDRHLKVIHKRIRTLMILTQHLASTIVKMIGLMLRKKWKKMRMMDCFSKCTTCIIATDVFITNNQAPHSQHHSSSQFLDPCSRIGIVELCSKGLLFVHVSTWLSTRFKWNLNLRSRPNREWDQFYWSTM